MTRLIIEVTKNKNQFHQRFLKYKDFTNHESNLEWFRSFQKCPKNYLTLILAQKSTGLF